MLRSTLVRLICLTGWALSSPVWGSQADEPAKPEPLAMPRESEVERVIEEDRVPTWVYFRTSRYDVWQYYGVDYQGRFRPRVIYSPCGPYYLYNGEPYPWVTTHDRDVMPRVVD
jgi:hypothetical protein